MLSLGKVVGLGLIGVGGLAFCKPELFGLTGKSLVHSTHFHLFVACQQIVTLLFEY